MITHALKENLISVSIANVDFSYRIPVKKAGNTIDWRVGEKGKEGIVFKGVSKWTLQLFTKKITEEKYIKHFKKIVQEYCPDNTINWEETLLAVKVQNQYNWLSSTKEKTRENEIIPNLKKKYKLD